MTPDPSRTRIVLTLDTGQVDVSELDAMLRLARRMNADLEGMFVEDSDLLRLDALGFLREFKPSSMRVEPIEAGRMQQELKALASRARRGLAEFSRARGIEVPFSVWRGSVSRELLGAVEADVLALLRVGAVRANPARTRPQSVLAVLFDDGEEAVRTLRVAAGLAADAPARPLKVLACGGPDLAEMARETALSFLSADTAKPVVIPLAGRPGPSAVARELEKCASTVLVVNRRSALLSPSSMRLHLASVDCATILVS